MTINDVVVEDEPAVLIFEALLSLQPGDAEADGMTTLTGAIGGDSGSALLHALGRVEARLRADDMRSILAGALPGRRTEEQRRADAFVILVDRVDEALAEWCARNAR